MAHAHDRRGFSGRVGHRRGLSGRWFAVRITGDDGLEPREVDLPISSSTERGVRIIALGGAVGENEAAELRALLVRTIMREHPRAVRIEIDEASSLDSTAIGALLAAVEIAREQDLDLEIRCLDRWAAARLAERGVHVTAA